MRKRRKRWGLWKIIIICAIVVTLILSGTDLALYVNFLLGNDIRVQLNANDDFFVLAHGEEMDAVFEAKVTVNMFCKAMCSYTFADISNEGIIEKNETKMMPEIALEKKYKLNAKNLGEGIDLYRFSIECRGIKTRLCQTSGEPSKRSSIIAVKYELNDYEKLARDELKEDAHVYLDEMNAIKNKEKAFDEAISELDKKANRLKINFTAIKNGIISANDGKKVKELWAQQDYFELRQMLIKSNEMLFILKNDIDTFNTSIMREIEKQNTILNVLNDAREKIKGIAVNENTKSEVEELANEFNYCTYFFNARNSVDEKEAMLKKLQDRLNATIEKTADETKKEVIKKSILLDTEYEALCRIWGLCIEYNKNAANATEFDLSKSCDELNALRGIYSQSNSTIEQAYLKENYTANERFTGNITAKVLNAKQQIINEYLGGLNGNETNYATINSIFSKKEINETAQYDKNLTAALAKELIKKQPGFCDSTGINDINATEIKLMEYSGRIIDAELKEQAQKCCIFGVCKECKENQNIPVLFLHGHSIIEEESVESSVAGFNQITEKLEKDKRFLDAGTVTVSSKCNASEDLLGLFDLRLMVGASYYFDMFTEAEKYVITKVQGQSIDNYAVRLKELIDIALCKTGKEKVNVVAFSMGGLVARRYLQIFGADKVNKLILISVPNKGLSGEALEYCNFLSEKNECKDLDSNGLLINQLNREPMHGIKIYNIVGRGCAMDGGFGDGVVLEKNSILENANNYFINGTCAGKFETLHTGLKKIERYPEVYDIISGALSG